MLAEVIFILAITRTESYQLQKMDKYHSYEEMTGILHHFNDTFHSLTNLYSIGKSTQGKELWVLEIAADEAKNQVRPNVKLIGNIHGNEPVGKELLIQFAKYLLINYQINNRINKLLNFARIHILPCLNPDGSEKALDTVKDETRILHRDDCESTPGRLNHNGYDLNRNFPNGLGSSSTEDLLQPETVAVQKWMEQTSFVLSASLLGGDLVAIYPYDYHSKKEENLTPDDDVFKHLASVYAGAHPKMHLETPLLRKCLQSKETFKDGITNGAAWYPLKGSMQDFNYIKHGCMEFSFEISCCKFPNASELPQYWYSNREALLSFSEEAFRAFRGIVRDEDGSPVYNATLEVLGRFMPFRTNKYGEFWRIQLPGIYLFKVSADGFQTRTVAVNVPNPPVPSDILIITLNRTGSSTDKSTIQSPLTSNDLSNSTFLFETDRDAQFEQEHYMDPPVIIREPQTSVYNNLGVAKDGQSTLIFITYVIVLLSYHMFSGN